jgi:DNA-binding transcriptional LysR family regulator
MSSDISLRRLEYFVTVADELHFGRAAQRLHVAQPALSQQIRQLEIDLGLTLLERTTRRVSLTADGATFLTHARGLLVSARSVARVAEEIRGGARGRLRLAYVDSTAYEFVPRFLHHFGRVWPNAEIELFTMSSDEQAQAIVAGDVDLGIARAVPARPAVDSSVLGFDRLVVAMPADHRIAGQASTRLRHLSGETFVGFSRDRSPSLHAEIRSMLASHNIQYDPAIEAAEYTTIVGLVAAGEGVALVPASIRHLQLPNVVYVAAIDSGAALPLVRLSRIGEPQTIVANAIEELHLSKGLTAAAEAPQAGVQSIENRSG